MMYERSVRRLAAAGSGASCWRCRRAGRVPRVRLACALVGEHGRISRSMMVARVPSGAMIYAHAGRDKRRHSSRFCDWAAAQRPSPPSPFSKTTSCSPRTRSTTSPPRTSTTTSPSSPGSRSTAISARASPPPPLHRGARLPVQPGDHVPSAHGPRAARLGCAQELE